MFRTEPAILDCVVRKVSEEVEFKLRSKWREGANCTMIGRSFQAKEMVIQSPYDS